MGKYFTTLSISFLLYKTGHACRAVAEELVRSRVQKDTGEATTHTASRSPRRFKEAELGKGTEQKQQADLQG